MDAGNLSYEKLFTGVISTKYSTVAALAFLAYEHSITFATEVEFVWNIKWSFGKILFIVNRYFGLFALIVNTTVFFSESLTNEFCEGFFWWEGTACVIAILNTEIILQTHVYAVFGRNNTLLTVMVALCVVEKVTTLILIGRLNFGGFEISPINSLTGCYAAGFPNSYFFTWIPTLIFEPMLCFLMLFKAWNTYRQAVGFPLLDLIIRDSVLYFVAIFVVLLVNCFVWAFASQVTIQVALGWVLAIPCAVGSRLLLNMREQCFREETEVSEDRTRLDLHVTVPAAYVTQEHDGSAASLDANHYMA